MNTMDPLVEETEAAQLDVGRVSDMNMNPRALMDTFAEDPECATEKQESKNPRSMLFAGATIDDDFELKKLQVFVRIRPSITEGTPKWGAENCIHASSKHSLAIAPPESSLAYKTGDRGQTYSFSQVFPDSTDQQAYFEGTAAPLVADLLRNPAHNSVMMAYGITAAGKTYTLEGTKSQPGVVPRALSALFEGLQSHVEPLTVRISYFEVYNEQLYDLMEDAPVAWPRERPQLKLKEDSKGRVFVQGLTEVEVNSAEEALAAFKKGAKQRQRAETGLNQGSSRSHSIFTISLCQHSEVEEEEDTGGEKKALTRLGRMAFVDLAGLERAQRTGNSGVRLKESVAINSSLMTLGRCLEALRWNQQNRGGAIKVVPFRESKVTHLFRDALHGYGRVVLSVNVSPCARDYDETTHVLRYAALATNIGTLQQAEAPRRTIKAVGPACYENNKHKRKAKELKQAEDAKKRKSIEGTDDANPEAEQHHEQQQQQQEGGEILDDIEEDIDDMEPAVYDVAPPPSKIPQPPASQQPFAAQEKRVALASPSTDGFVLQRAQHDPASVAPYSPAQQEGDDVDGAPWSGPPGAMADAATPLSYDGTPMTPSDEGHDDDVVATLQAQVQDLFQKLQEAEEKAVMLESEVREEVAEEMAQLLKDMEANYRERLASEVAAAQGGAGGNKGRKGPGKQQRPGSAGSDKGTAAEKPVVDEALVQRAQEAEATVTRLQQEMELFEAQARAQADRIAKLEASLAAAQASESEAQQELGRVSDELATQRTQHEQEMTTMHNQILAVTAERAASIDNSTQFSDRLRDEVMQVEANRAMEVEMAEQQADRLRKENAALKQKMEALMAALGSSITSPSAPSAFKRVIASCPAGNGRGAAGTPHDIALARARLAVAAAAAEEGGVAPPMGLLKTLVKGPRPESAGPPGIKSGTKGPSRFATSQPTEPVQEEFEEASPAVALASPIQHQQEQQQQEDVEEQHENQVIIENSPEVAMDADIDVDVDVDVAAMETIPEDEPQCPPTDPQQEHQQMEEEEDSHNDNKDDDTDQSNDEERVEEELQEAIEEQPKRRKAAGRGSRRATHSVVDIPQQEQQQQEEEEEEEGDEPVPVPEPIVEEEEPVPKKRRGRPPARKKQGGAKNALSASVDSALAVLAQQQEEAATTAVAEPDANDDVAMASETACSPAAAETRATRKRSGVAEKKKKPAAGGRKGRGRRATTAATMCLPEPETEPEPEPLNNNNDAVVEEQQQVNVEVEVQPDVAPPPLDVIVEEPEVQQQEVNAVEEMAAPEEPEVVEEQQEVEVAEQVTAADGDDIVDITEEQVEHNPLPVVPEEQAEDEEEAACVVPEQTELKENQEERPLSGCSKEEPVSEAEPPAPKGRRRRLLQPAKPMSNQMKAALGDWESNDCGVLKDIAAAKLGGGTAGQKKGAAGAAAGSAKAGGGRMVPLSPAMFSPKQFRTRRQTALHKAAK